MSCTQGRERSRAAAAQLAGTGASAVGPPPTPSAYPALLCEHGHAQPTASAYGIGAAVGLPNSVPALRDRCNCKGKSVMTAYTPLLFRGIPRPPSRRPGGAPGTISSGTLRPRRGAPAAVRRRPCPDRYRFAHPSLYELDRGLGPLSEPGRSGSDAGPLRSGSQGSPRFLRFLPGSPPVDVNAVTQINFSK